jgi:hypothetical protein
MAIRFRPAVADLTRKIASAIDPEPDKPEPLQEPKPLKAQGFDRAAYQKAYMKTYMKDYMRRYRAKLRAKQSQ